MSFDLSAANTTPTLNFLVPSQGTTNLVQLSGTLVANEPITFNWLNFNSQNQPFQPQGVYIDNSAGTAEMTIVISASPGGPSIWTIDVDAGYVMHTAFPAPNGQVHTVEGAGVVNLVYVDFPVLFALFKP